MTGNEIRQKFLDFFKSKGHTIVASDSVVPKDDPTVLFTTAGMQQFKRQFLGHIEDYTTAASSQKCIRTDDLDEVGQTDFHHTFFEMLGNFSFGDYFKKEAIEWGWEFLTKVLKIDSNRLWVSVYKDDKEAYDIWLKNIKVPKEKIFKLGAKSNFWPANAKENGPNGPCGPCSEIFYDYEPNKKSIPNDPDEEPGRFSEVWNLVFTQYNRKEGGELEPLPSKNIDTGMGLERLTAVMQGVKSNYETDLFTPILKAIDKEVPGLEDQKRFILADHLRGVTFGINDGVVPSNEGRGYVIKKLIVSISDIAISSGQNQPVIYKLVSSVADAMKDGYPDVTKKVNNIGDTVKSVENSYIKVRKERLPKLEAEIKATEDFGEIIFQYRDTYGLTLPSIHEVAHSVGKSEKAWDKALKQYEKLMDEQKERSRAASNISKDVFMGMDLNLDVPKTKFTGYDSFEETAKILKIFKGNDEVKEAKKGDQVKVVLDKTCFYAESGGQIGDVGSITTNKGNCEVTDTQSISDIFIHSGKVQEGSIKANDTAEIFIDKQRRLSIMRNHTATHILQAALREVLGTHVQQQGSLVAEDRLRFDFTHPKAIQRDEIKKIEDYVNNAVLACDEVTKEVLPLEEAKKKGALAFFAEKYGDTVRVVSVGTFSKEFCGGTHLNSTGQIGLFKIFAESAIAQGIRRLEAKTGAGALSYVNDQESQLNKISQAMKAPESEVVERVQSQTKRLKTLERELDQYRLESIKGSIDSIIKDAKSVAKTKVVTHVFKDLEFGTLRNVADLIKQKQKDAIIVLGSKSNGNALLMVAVTDAVVKKNVKANELIAELSPLIDGSGGGSPKLAQAGSKSVNKLNTAVEKSLSIIKEKLS